MVFKYLRLFGKAIFLSILITGNVQAISVTSGDVLRIDFDLTGQTPEMPYQHFAIFAETAVWLEGEQAYLSLYNGGTLWKDPILLKGDLVGVSLGGGPTKQFTGVGYWLIESLNASFDFHFATVEGTNFLPDGTADSTGRIATNAYLVPPVPIPAAVWLFSSGLLGLIGVARRRANA